MLRQTIKYVAYSGYKYLGVNRRIRRQNRDKAIVLTYHGVLPEVPPDGMDFEYRNFVTIAQFEAQIRFLLKHYRPLAAADFYNPEKSTAGGFLITFDDGFRNNRRYAMPLLRQYGIQGCFFITTGLIGSREYLWTEQVTLMLEHTRRSKLEITLDTTRVFELDTPSKREAASREIRKHLKQLPSGPLKHALTQMREQLDDVDLTVGPDEEERYLFMTWEEIREMIANGQLIGSHTHTHPMLSTLTEEESRRELELPKKAIEKETGQPCLTISYPNGERENYSDMTIRHLQELGYRCAFTQVPLFNRPDTDPFQLHRVNISLKMSMPVFEAALVGRSL